MAFHLCTDLARIAAGTIRFGETDYLGDEGGNISVSVSKSGSNSKDIVVVVTPLTGSQYAAIYGTPPVTGVDFAEGESDTDVGINCLFTCSFVCLFVYSVQLRISVLTN